MIPGKCVHFSLLQAFFWILIPTSSFSKDFRVIDNLSYTNSGNKRHHLDLFIPQERKKLNSHPSTELNVLPLVVWIHGGGWQHGNKESARNPARLPKLIETGRYAGASINYRLSGETKWPSQVHDCKAAIRWLRGNVARYGIDPKKIAVWGSSAGGHLASMLGVSANNPELEGNLGSFQNISSRVQAVINYYGPSSFLKMDNYPSKINHRSPDSPESKLLGIPIHKNRRAAKGASPFHYVKNGLPPFINFHGTDDLLVPYNQSLILHKKLVSYGNSSSLITVPNGGHFMPAHFTEKIVIPFLDFQFYNVGKKTENKSILLRRN